MSAVLGLLTMWCLLIVVAILVSARRSREFERALAAAGFVTVSPAPPLAGMFRRRDAVVSRVVSGVVQGVGTTFIFGFRPGDPPPLEGAFINARIPIAAVLLTTSGTRAWLGTWTDHRAYELGWHPAYVADLTPDGRILLAWENFRELRSDFESCCSALARSWATAPKAVKPRADPALSRFNGDRDTLAAADAHGE